MPPSPPPCLFQISNFLQVIAFYSWRKLFGRTVPPNNTLFGGTVPPNNTLFGGTVPPNNTLFGGTVPPNSTLFGGTPDSEK